MDIIDFAQKFITYPLTVFAFGMLLMYCLLIWMDSIVRKKLGRQQKNGISDTDADGKVTVAYPPGFKFLLEEEPEHAPATMEEEVKSLVRLYESREISIYSILHRLLDYSKRISEYKNDAEKTQEKLNGQITELRKMSGNLTATKDEYKATIGDLENKLEEAGRELEKSQRSHEEFAKKQGLANEEFEEKLQNLRQEKTDLTKQNTDLSHEADDLRSKKNSLQEQLDTEKQKSAELEKHVETFRNKVTETAGELEKARSSQDEIMEDLRERIEDLEDENRSLKSRLEKVPREEDIERLEQEKEELTARIDKYGKQREKSDEEKQNLSARIDEYEKQCEKIGKEKNETLAALETYKRQYSELAQNIENYRKQDTISNEGFPLAEETPVAKALYNENKELARKAEEYVETIDRMKVELAELETLQTENSQLKNTFNEKVEKKTAPLFKRIKELEQKITDSKGSDISRSGEMQELEETLAERDSEIEQLNDVLEKTEQESVRLNAILEKKDKALRKIESQKKKLSRDITNMLEYDDTESRDLVLSDIDLLSEISEPDLPKTGDIPNIVNVEVAEEVQEDKKESATKATEEYSPKTADTTEEKTYNVFLPKLTTEAKKQKAIPLLEEISGISHKEAEKLVNKIVIPVIKGIKRDKADEIKERFKEAGIFPRIKRQL